MGRINYREPPKGESLKESFDRLVEEIQADDDRYYEDLGREQQEQREMDEYNGSG